MRIEKRSQVCGRNPAEPACPMESHQGGTRVGPGGGLPLPPVLPRAPAQCHGGQRLKRGSGQSKSRHPRPVTHSWHLELSPVLRNLELLWEAAEKRGLGQARAPSTLPSPHRGWDRQQASPAGAIRCHQTEKVRTHANRSSLRTGINCYKMGKLSPTEGRDLLKPHSGQREEQSDSDLPTRSRCVTESSAT